MLSSGSEKCNFGSLCRFFGWLCLLAKCWLMMTMILNWPILAPNWRRWWAYSKAVSQHAWGGRGRFNQVPRGLNQNISHFKFHISYSETPPFPTTTTGPTTIFHQVPWGISWDNFTFQVSYFVFQPMPWVNFLMLEKPGLEFQLNFNNFFKSAFDCWCGPRS